MYRCRYQIYTWYILTSCRWCLREIQDAPADDNRVTIEMHLEAMIKQVWRCTRRPWSSRFGDALGGRDRVNTAMHLESVTERDWRYTWRLWSTEFGDGFEPYNWATLEEYLGVVDGRCARCWDSIHQLVAATHHSGLWPVNFPYELTWRVGWWRSILEGAMQEAEGKFSGWCQVVRM
jgi:hypothetical protein